MRRRLYIDGYKVSFEEVIDDILNEVYYLVTFNGHTFVMAYDKDLLHLIIQGAAPYLARHYEIDISDRIEAYNDDLI